MELYVKLRNRKAFKTLRPSGCTVECGACDRFRNMGAIACEHHEKIANESHSTNPGAPGINDQRVPARREATGNGQTDFWVRRVSAMANRIGFLAG